MFFVNPPDDDEDPDDAFDDDDDDDADDWSWKPPVTSIAVSRLAQLRLLILFGSIAARELCLRVRDIL